MQRAYAAHHRNPQAVEYASSGGVFAALAQHTLAHGGAVYGAAMQDGDVRCLGATTQEQLRRLCGSKYVFVPVAPVLNEIAERIAADQPVLVVTSPCQAAAVRQRCGDSTRLTVVDFVCHGAPEPAFLHKYLEECSAAQGSAVDWVNFRKKIPGRSWEQYQTEMHYTDGNVQATVATDNPYMRLFLCNASLRRACGQCAWKGEHRASDLTLGDFWGIAKIQPSGYHKEGTSLVLVNTPHGEQLWAAVQEQLVCEEVNCEEALQYNASALQPAQLHPQYDSFRKDSETMGVAQLAQKYAKVSGVQKAKQLAKRLLRRG